MLLSTDSGNAGHPSGTVAPSSSPNAARSSRSAVRCSTVAGSSTTSLTVAVCQAGPVIVAFSVSPSGGDESGGVGAAVAEAVRVVRESGLPNETNAMFTNIEGEWDEVMAVVKRAVEAVAAAAPRVSLVLKADIRPGFTGQLTAKVQRIEDQLGG
jgi:uncharacterized protein (TIGR00106 family)